MAIAPADHERFVAARFDALHGRFGDRLDPDDFRLGAILRALGPLAGRRILDLGCGKGRFARRLRDGGAEVIGMDPSRGMLAHATGCRRVLGTARRLPFAPGAFDAVVAVEVLQHVARPVEVIREVRRVLRPGGAFLLVDRNGYALDPGRPWLPSVWLKRIDQARGYWMYPAGGPVRERWFWPRRLARQLGEHFPRVRVEHLLSPREAETALFRRLPWTRGFALWEARLPGVDPHEQPPADPAAAALEDAAGPGAHPPPGGHPVP